MIQENIKFSYLRQPPKKWTFEQPRLKKWIEERERMAKLLFKKGVKNW
jgi:hypothetical protein